MDNIINEIPEYILTVVVSAVLIFVINSVRSYIHAKALSAKSSHAKEVWSFVDKVSETAVTSLVSADMSGDQKFVEATRLVQSSLDKQGFANVDASAIEAAVQAAYEKSPLTPSASQNEEAKLAKLPSPMSLQVLQTKPGSQPATPQLDQRVAGKGIPVEATQQANKSGDNNGAN